MGFLTFFLFGTFWFYLITAGFITLALIFTKNESGIWALISLTLYGLYFQCFAKIDLINWIINNPLMFFLFAGLYLIIGLFWSMFKWHLLVSSIAEEKNEAFQTFLKKENLPRNTKALSQKQHKTWIDSISYRFKKPLFSKNKNRIILWLSYWPFSALWFTIHDAVKKISHRIVMTFQKTYERITTKAFKKVDNIEVIDEQ